MKRMFISIKLPEEVKKEIQRIQEQLPEFKGKKTEVENLHLTLKFLGEIEDEKIEEVKERLRGIKFRKFRSEIKNVGVFSPKLIKIVWIYLSGCARFQKVVDAVLKGLFGKEKRFMSHITIARVKDVEDKKKFLEELGKLKVGELKFEIDKFYLMESVLREEGPEYKVVENFFLK